MKWKLRRAERQFAWGSQLFNPPTSSLFRPFAPFHCSSACWSDPIICSLYPSLPIQQGLTLFTEEGSVVLHLIATIKHSLTWCTHTPETNCRHTHRGNERKRKKIVKVGKSNRAASWQEIPTLSIDQPATSLSLSVTQNENTKLIY